MGSSGPDEAQSDFTRRKEDTVGLSTPRMESRALGGCPQNRRGQELRVPKPQLFLGPVDTKPNGRLFLPPPLLVPSTRHPSRVLRLLTAPHPFPSPSFSGGLSFLGSECSNRADKGSTLASRGVHGPRGGPSPTPTPDPRTLDQV